MMKKGHLPEGSQNVIRIHHSVAFKASDYAKKQHVFRLVTADWAEFLFQTRFISLIFIFGKIHFPK
jgi:PH/SEC7 domain-containing protein